MRIDAAYSRTLVAGTDYSLQVMLKGTTLSIVLNGDFVASFAFNGVVVDGAFGLAVWSGTGSFASFRLRTNDLAFPTGPNGEPSTGPGPTSTTTSTSTSSSTTTSNPSTGPPGKN
jgi:hypothetical protein